MLRAIARLLVATLLVSMTARASALTYPDVTPDYQFAFPRDHGAHPDFRTEWWYVTGWLKTASGDDLGFQVTFFRSRMNIDDRNPSRFAPRQLIFAHAALADAKLGRLLHDQRASRAGFGIAEAASGDADVVIDNWRFKRMPDSPADPLVSSDALRQRFITHVDGSEFGLDLTLVANDAPLLQGANAATAGYSQKGPNPKAASRYYSVPQLAVSGTLTRGGKPLAVRGTAWLDREWSSAYLDPRAAGWDWTGINLADGGALMAFQMRGKDGSRIWAGGSRRHADGHMERFGPDDVRFTPLRTWRSAKSGAIWPVAQKVEIGSNDAYSPSSITPMTIALEPLMDDQELDSRASTGTIYWEGAVRALHGDGSATDARAQVGMGYLELTGYWRPIKF